MLWLIQLIVCPPPFHPPPRPPSPGQNVYFNPVTVATPLTSAPASASLIQTTNGCTCVSGWSDAASGETTGSLMYYCLGRVASVDRGFLTHALGTTNCTPAQPSIPPHLPLPLPLLTHYAVTPYTTKCADDMASGKNVPWCPVAPGSCGSHIFDTCIPAVGRGDWTGISPE